MFARSILLQIMTGSEESMALIQRLVLKYRNSYR